MIENDHVKYIKMLASVLDKSDFISSDRVNALLNKAGPVRLTIDGNCACALLGENLHDGECSFVEIHSSPESPIYKTEAKQRTVEALRLLTARCYPDGEYSLPFYVGDHPLYCE